MKENNKSNNKILWINGLKGLACMGVFLHHFFLAFLPATYFGSEYAISEAKGVDSFLSTSVLSLPINGNFHVMVFFVISSFLIASSVFRITAEGKDTAGRLGDIAFKRYFRLMPPILVWSVIYHIVIKQTDLSVLQAVMHSLLWVFTSPDEQLMGPLWCIHYLFIGTFVAMIVALIDGNGRKKVWIFYLLLNIALLKSYSHYFVIMLGVDLAYLINRTKFKDRLKEHNKKLVVCIGIVLLLIGIFLGAYPSIVVPENYYAPLYAVGQHIGNFYVICHGVGAALLILSIYMLGPVQKILELGFLQFLGDISYGVFLTHSLVLDAFSVFLMNKLQVLLGGFTAGFIVTLIICTNILLALSLVSKFTIERFTEKMLRKVVEGRH